MDSTSIAERVAAADIPQDQADGIVARLEAAYAAGYVDERTTLLGRASDIAHNNGRHGETRAILGRAFGKVAGVAGPIYGSVVRPFARTAAEYIGNLSEGEHATDPNAPKVDPTPAD